MLTPEYLATFASHYLAMVDSLNEQIVRDIVKGIMKNGSLSKTTTWQIRSLQESGMVLDDITDSVARFTGYSEKQIVEMFNKAGVVSIQNDGKALQAAGIVSEVKLSKTMSKVLLSNAKKTAGDCSNLTRTTASQGQSLYMETLNEAFMMAQSGAYSFPQVLRHAIKKAASQGAYVEYDTGAKVSIDAALRMSLLTGLNQTVAEITEMYASDIGAEYYEISAHAGARPEHAVWQGRVFKINGSTPKYENFYIATGYGEGTGLCGWNCRHSFYPFWPGISERLYTDEALAELNNRKCTYKEVEYSDYEASQKQRYYERQIRESRRLLAAYDSAILNADGEETKKYCKEQFEKESVRLKKREARIKEFCKETGKKLDPDRYQVHAAVDDDGNIVSFNRSVSMKAVWANRRASK